ncbi:MAG: response regulator [Candidatus Omnitrophica bacterium]|nr:response regulator [Candidatus Omnitrophota bacterium]
MEKKRILVIDDEVTVTRGLKLYLEGTGNYEVRTENEGAKGVEAAREFLPHIIVLDVIMPDVDGGSVAMEIKADSMVKDTPIVFLTAIVSREEVVAQDNLFHGHPFLAKPVSPEELVNTIETVINS